MNLSRHALTLVAALLLSSIAPTIYAQSRVAVVDLQRAMNETEDGRRAKARLKRLFKRRQQALDERQKALKVLKEEIEQQSSVWNEQTKRTKVETYQKALVELQQSYMEYQRELAEQEGRLTREIIARMERIMRRLGQSEGYSLIMERNEAGVVWVPSNLDLTDNVIQRYNAGEGRAEGESGGSGSGSTKRRRRRRSKNR